MSHLQERGERNCLNCNAQLYGKYCHICGQENIQPKETVWHLVSHFFQDITHFDGKFFNTLGLLVFRPGFLSREYVAGRRASYLNPIRMYVFTSAIFFLIFFTLFKGDETKGFPHADVNGKSFKDVAKMDSAKFAQFTIALRVANGDSPVPMKMEDYKRYADSLLKVKPLGIRFSSTKEYDSLLAAGAVKD
ncbi:MAG TPA: DUF3667 domain-containing protein, partial [Ferruginibacter sp.]|nr:DUF3667 domain-containing protein [Ferruginibacter sp.]